MRSTVTEHRGPSHVRAHDTAQGHFDRAHRIGSETKEELDSIAAQGDKTTAAIENGDVTPDEGRRAIDSLLARHSAAASRADTFAASADACIAIEDDPEAWSEAFFAAHPSVRPEMGF